MLAEQLWADACADADDDGVGVTREQLGACYAASAALFEGTRAAERQLAKWRATVGRKQLVPAFGQAGKALLGATLAQYDAATAGAHPASRAVGAARRKLGGHVRAELEALFGDQVRIVQAEAVSKLRELLLLTVARQGSIQEWQVANTQTSIERWFTAKLAELAVPELALNMASAAAHRARAQGACCAQGGARGAGGGARSRAPRLPPAALPLRACAGAAQGRALAAAVLLRRALCLVRDRAGAGAAAPRREGQGGQGAQGAEGDAAELPAHGRGAHRGHGQPAVLRLVRHRYARARPRATARACRLRARAHNAPCARARARSLARLLGGAQGPTR